MRTAHQKYWIVSGAALLLLLAFLHLMSWEWDFSFLKDDVILQSIRLPRTFSALFCGILLAVSGLLLQILFSNPLAGPSILGISSGASLGVAIAIILGVNTFGISTASFIGALSYSILLLLVGRFVKSTTSLLLVGIMLSSFTNAFIEILQVYAQEAKLKYFTLWGMGSLQQVNGTELVSFFLALLVVLLFTLYIHRDLTVFAQGEEFASYLGVNVSRLRWLIIIVTSLAVAVTTAYCGPVSFVGIAVPNLVRIVLKTANSKILIIGCLIFGPVLLLLCDGLILLLDNYFILPINSMTALFGVPFIIWIIFKQAR
ncbi:MAG: iron ABC transporter permease [Flavobacteriia bacterium]|nr:iron ABC transporter permease [Flavobacteriia bacterium]OJX36200.1 MAG: hypothetical protein BGO87_06980 [Flavobacteriia bacterium 40-80]